MSHADDFKDDFGPVRLASVEEIREAKLQRQNRGKSQRNSVSDTSTSSSVSSAHLGSDTKDKEEHFATENPSENPSEIHAPDTPTMSHSTSSAVFDKEELIKYSVEKQLRKLRKQKQAENKGSVKKQRRQLKSVPLDDATREKILAELSAKKRAAETAQIAAQDPSGGYDLDSELVNISSDSEFEDAMEILDASRDPADASDIVSLMAPDTARLADQTGKEAEVVDAAIEQVSAGGDDQEMYQTVYFDPEKGIEADNPGELLQETEENGMENDVDMDHAEKETKNAPPTQTATAHDYPSHEDIQKMKRIILSQVNGNTPLPIEISSLYAPYKEIYSIFSHTIHDSESHTVLLTGPAGSGKTTIVEQALQKLENLNPDTFITIRLSGSLHHTDQHAIREIARQLDLKLKDFAGEDDNTYEQRAISDTFHNILSALFKLDDPNADSEDVPIRVIFVIDEMERFIGGKQTILYNLFELSQVSKVPICIVGVTPRITLVDSFEKRVKSRFSQRRVQTSRASTLESFWENAKIALTVAESRFADFGDENYPKQWNAHIEQLFRTQSGLTKSVYRTFYTTKSHRQFNNECAFPISKISQNRPFPHSDDFNTYSNLALCGVEAMVASLSTAELLTVVAAARWVVRSPSQVNFKLAYREYVEMMKNENKESTTLFSKTSYIDNQSLAGIKITKSIYPAKVLQGCWRVIYRTGLLFDVITGHNEANPGAHVYKDAMLDDSKMLQLDITLDELARAIPEDNYVRRFTRL